MQPIEVSKRAIMELEERAIEAKGELCEALACASMAELVFKEKRDWVDALSRSSVRAAIKSSKMCLQLTKAWKRKTQIIAKTETDIANIKRDHWMRLKELREQADVQIGWL